MSLYHWSGDYRVVHPSYPTGYLTVFCVLVFNFVQLQPGAFNLNISLLHLLSIKMVGDTK